MTASTPNSVRASRIEICSVTCGSHTCAQRVNNNMLRMTRSRVQRHTSAVSALRVCQRSTKATKKPAPAMEQNHQDIRK